jgi:isoleucyl-tRNA synthetase
MAETEEIKENFPRREERILDFWKKQQIFQKSIQQREKKPLFSFYDGPPFATGLPHYGHLLAGTIKDVIPRYKTMKGFYVPRRFGWDCHGLPIENEIEKAHNLNGAASIEAFGIANFNEACRNIVRRYSSEWQSTVERMGRWVDFDKNWHTMDMPFMESVWWVFKQLYEKGLIYEGFKVMPYSAKLGTPLSNFEASDNYKDVDDPSLFVTFTLSNDSTTSLLIWTTTPWTLISNIAIAVGSEIDYVKVEDKATKKRYIVAEKRLDSCFKDETSYTIIETMKGEQLKGLSYVPPFNHFIQCREQGAFKVIVDGFVTLEDGTGLVHTAPGFGEADFYACQKEGLPLVCPVDQNGQFTDEVPEYKGRFVKDCDKEIIKKLKEEGKVLRHETIHHRYPYCWRSDTPLIYKAVATWFVAVEKIKNSLLASNEAIYWMPEHIKQGRFGKWLEGARDWAISRNRYWGTPIPVWQSDEGDIHVIGSIKELEELTGKKVSDLHRHFIDDLSFEKEGKKFKRISEVFDCWFESGSMPYAEKHYPFENKESFEKAFPADFIAEGLDQTRGWFYTLTVLSSALFKKPAFKNCIVNGLILASDGTKMSKKLRNYPDPIEMISKHGADSVRLYMLNSPAVKGEDLCFSEQGLENVLKQVLIPFWSSYSFFMTYAKLYGFTPHQILKPAAQLDRWMISIVQKLIHDVESAMDRYDLSHAVHPFVDFIDQLTNWYIRRSRRRFWNDEATQDRKEAFETLYFALMTLCKIAAPFVPFISEAIFQQIRTEKDPESIHLADFPLYREELRDLQLEEEMALVQEVVSLGHSLRKEKELKVRQPLKEAFIISSDAKTLTLLSNMQELIKEELNVQKVAFTRDETAFVQLSIKPNFRVLGKKIGKFMKQAAAHISTLLPDQCTALQAGKSISFVLEGTEVIIDPEDVVIERIVKPGIHAATAQHITVALDIELNDELIQQGIVRELINKINTLRKELRFLISDRIHLLIECSPEIKKAIELHKSHISNEVLALSIMFGTNSGSQIEINEELLTLTLTKGT